MMPPTTKQKQQEAVANLLKDMESIAGKMRALIVGMPPEDLLGYIYIQRIMEVMALSGKHLEKQDIGNPNDTTNEIQFLLEYVHAVLASDEAPNEVKFDEAKCAELFSLSSELRDNAMIFAMASSADTENDDFGPDTGNFEFQIKSTWILLRGNRYQVLEGEFYRYVLTPHDDVLNEVYGVGAIEIAEGFQDMANATRSGHANALLSIEEQSEAAHDFAAEQEKPLEDVIQSWGVTNKDRSETARFAMDDILRGGIANVSRHTKLPPDLLSDLAYQRGEESEFFADGDFKGTPYRTLPARKKPLIQLDSGYYAVDPCFTRDSGYRALLFNLLRRLPEYKKSFEDRQKIMSEGAFTDILSDQLYGATVYKEVYYKDPVTRQWSETDTLVLLDDVLYLVEAKAGAAATIASPALDFKRHTQSANELVLKAYRQCERFFNYLNSEDEVSLYRLVDGNYKEVGLIRHSDYRVMFPIGLTVESFSPFSSLCKELPEVEPILGKYGFISMSIDDLFVLKRILPTAGIFAHYMEVRQSVAGMKGAHLFDELDHLGAYITKNRFDQDIADQLKDGKADLVIWNGMSSIIDRNFEGVNWETKPVPTQKFPDAVLELLKALNTTQAPGWLSAESVIRNYGEQAREDIAKKLCDICKTIKQYPSRYFAFTGEGQPLFVWIQNSHHVNEWETINDKASAAALCTNSLEVFGLLIEIGEGGVFDKAQYFKVNLPYARTDENAHIFDDAYRMSQRLITKVPLAKTGSAIPKQTNKIGRNEPCPCGSGVKYKKCHGR